MTPARDEERPTGTTGPQDTAAPGPAGAGERVRAAAEGKVPPEQVAQPEAGAGEGDMAGDTPTELVADLAKAQQDVATLTADLQRLQAEYLNYKRRVDRDRELTKDTAKFSVLSALLPVLDDIDRARDAGELEGGFKAVADSLERIVTGLGLRKFGRPGDEFDPMLHEALMHSHSPDVTTTTCQHIVQAGYRMGDRVVRAARVTVVDPEPGPVAGEGAAAAEGPREQAEHGRAAQADQAGRSQPDDGTEVEQ